MVYSSVSFSEGDLKKEEVAGNLKERLGTTLTKCLQLVVTKLLRLPSRNFF